MGIILEQQLPSAHSFRSARRFAAIQKKNSEMLQLRMELAQARWELQSLHVTQSWDRTCEQEMLLSEIQSLRVENETLQCELQKLKQADDVPQDTTSSVVPASLVTIPSEKTTGQRKMSPIMGALLIQHRWRSFHIKLSPSSEDTINKAEESSECSVVGGPAALHTELIYTAEEFSKLCDALVGPLSIEIHSLQDPEVLFGSKAPKDNKHSLGYLLRNVCAKVVPLTTVLQDRRNTVQRLVGSQHTRSQTKRNESCSTEEVLRRSPSNSHSFAVGMRVKINDPDLLPKFRKAVSTIQSWDQKLKKFVISSPNSGGNMYYSSEELEEFATICN